MPTADTVSGRAFSKVKRGTLVAAIFTGAPVGVEDVRSTAGRWPRFSAAADAAGFRSVQIFGGFDGRPFELEDSGPVEVLFASRRGRNAADDDIAELVAQADEPGDLRVVTSDKELVERVRAGGGQVIGVGEFRRQLER